MRKDVQHKGMRCILDVEIQKTHEVNLEFTLFLFYMNSQMSRDLVKQPWWRLKHLHHSDLVLFFTPCLVGIS